MITKTVTKTRYYSDDGIQFIPGDMLIISAPSGDVIGRFGGVEGGYFILKSIDGENPNRLRLSTIEKCTIKVVDTLTIKTDMYATAPGERGEDHGEE